MKRQNLMEHLLTRVLLGAGLLAMSPLAFAGTATLATVALQKHDAGTFYVDGELRGYGGLRMLVDTGSSYLVISEKILAQLMESQTARYSRELQGVMADGSTRVIPMYRIAALRLGAHCWVHDIEAAVFPGQTRPILGMNVLMKLAPFTFSADPAELGVQCQLPPAAAPSEFTAVEAQDGGERAAGIAH